MALSFVGVMGLALVGAAARSFAGAPRSLVGVLSAAQATTSAPTHTSAVANRAGTRSAYRTDRRG
jgi:hypothetical protein